MTIDRDRTIKIPVWLVILVLPLAITLGGTYVYNRTNNARQQAKLESVEKSLERKVDQTEYGADVRNMKESLIRIELKLDEHIA